MQLFLIVFLLRAVGRAGFRPRRRRLCLSFLAGKPPSGTPIQEGSGPTPPFLQSTIINLKSEIQGIPWMELNLI